MEATSCQKKQLRHTSMLVSTRQVTLSTTLRLSAKSLQEDFADNLRAPIGTWICVLCNDARRVQRFFDLLTASRMLVASSVPCKKGIQSVILNVSMLWMQFID